MKTNLPNVIFFCNSPSLRATIDLQLSQLSEFITLHHCANTRAVVNLYKECEDRSSLITMILTEDDLHKEHLGVIRSNVCDAKILGIGFSRTVDEIKELFKIGYNGFLELGSNLSVYLDAFSKLLKKKYYLQSDMMDEFFERFFLNGNNGSVHLTVEQHKKLETLSKKEKEVVGYLIQGLSYKEIAQILSLTPFAINQRAKSIYKKCGVKTRNELSYQLLT